jgi:hypothetical protein
MIDLHRRCNRLANVAFIESTVDVQRLVNLRLKGVYTNERTEEDISFSDYIDTIMTFSYTLIK